MTAQEAWAIAWSKIASIEKGYVVDAGGATNFGISQRAFPDVDIKNLTFAEAEALAKTHYWDKCNCDNLPGALALCVFDGAYNQGAGTSAKLLQRALELTPDAVIGPKTIATVNAFATRYGLDTLISYYMAERALLYSRTPNFDIDGRGWYRRLFSVSLDTGKY